MLRLLGFTLLIVLLSVPWTLPASHAHSDLALTTTASPRAAYLPVVIRPAAMVAPVTVTPTGSAAPVTVTPTVSPTSSMAPPSPSITTAPLPTPTLPPPTFNNCQTDPNPSAAPNYPVRIVIIDKIAETVTLRNMSASAIDLTGWHMCSILGNQEHPISGTLEPDTQQIFNGPAGTIWNNSKEDDGALYNPNGQLVSYFADTTR